MGLLDAVGMKREMHTELEQKPFCVERGGLLIWGMQYRRAGLDRPLRPVILSHGFLSNQQSVTYYARQFALWGYAAFTFDFNGGGFQSKSEGAFSDMTLLTEVEDLGAVMDYVRELPDVRGDKLVLLGCSQGGAVSALTAAKRPGDVDRLILFYPALCIPDDARAGKMMMFEFDPANIPDRISANIFGRTMELGGTYPGCVKDMDIFEEIAPYHGKVLILHGDDDRVVNVSYGQRACEVYRAGRAQQVQSDWAKAHPGDPLPAALPDPDCHFVALAGAGHGFRGEQDTLAMQTVRAWLSGQAEVLTIDVQITGSSVETKGLSSTVRIPFTGGAKGQWFSGAIAPGGCDVQKRRLLKPESLAASYSLTGRDYTGSECEISIVNRSPDGRHWLPQVRTDSEALAFLNEQEAICLFENRKGGPVIHIYTAV